MKTLSESLAEYLSRVYPSGVHPSILAESRKAFFAGGLTMFKLAAEADSADARLALYEEAKKVCEEEIKVQKSNVVPMVEPYAPCPCGSGNKFKFCCGKKV
jgi:hypothetical protein